MLRRITRQQIYAKRKACMALLDGTVGEVLPGHHALVGRFGAWSAVRGKATFRLAMKLWHHRIVQAQHRNQLGTSGSAA